MDATWRDDEKVQQYVGRIGRLEARLAGEAELAEVVALDRSPPMLTLARERFRAEPRVSIRAGDMNDPLPELGSFDAVVSVFAIHHLPHARKRSLVAEIAGSLRPDGVFANLEVVECATPELQAEFYRRIGRPGGRFRGRARVAGRPAQLDAGRRAAGGRLPVEMARLRPPRRSTVSDASWVEALGTVVGRR